MKITRDELLIAAFKLFMSVNNEKASFAELGKMLCRKPEYSNTIRTNKNYSLP
ncbi:hypothetical protein BFGS084_02556 [Bacteroides fragilis]|nr:hypothetical protein BFGS084_02556 [Bacteroides fragilis]